MPGCAGRARKQKERERQRARVARVNARLDALAAVGDRSLVRTASAATEAANAIGAERQNTRPAARAGKDKRTKLPLDSLARTHANR